MIYRATSSALISQVRFRFQTTTFGEKVKKYVDRVDTTVDLCQLAKIRRLNPILNSLVGAVKSESNKTIQCPIKKVKFRFNSNWKLSLIQSDDYRESTGFEM